MGLTKRWSLYVASHGNSGYTRKKHSTDLRRARQSLITGSVRAVASGAVPIARLKAPLRATSSKSQPPHLVLDSHTYHYNQNLSFDHLLSGVIADYYEIRRLVNRACPLRMVATPD